MKEKEINIENIKYVFFDLDGTLLNSEKKISQLSLETIKKLKSLGIEVSIATGRHYYFLPNEIRAINPKIPVISCNSALVYDPIKKDVTSVSNITSERTKDIYDVLIKNNGLFLIYTIDKILMCKDEQKNLESKWFNAIKNINNNLDPQDQVEIVSIDTTKPFDITKYNVIKFLIIYSEIPSNNYHNIENKINTMNDVYIVRSQNEVFDIMPKGLTKGDGLQILHNKGIIDLEKTLVFGDAENDLSMFQKAKWSVAMGNAQEKVKEAATFITDSNSNEGIYNFFKKII